MCSKFIAQLWADRHQFWRFGISSARWRIVPSLKL
jgi:hypothetical protein